jgi:CheY-like chemotaxis protein
MNTVTDYVDMAMIVSGTMKLNMTNFLLVASLRNMIDTISLSCKAKNLEFESSFPDEPKNIILLSDIELLRKIIKELADNAIKFTSRGKISIVCEQIEGYLRFVVKDTGKGIAPEKLQMIFDLFTQEDMSTTRGYEGSGLGLSISKGLVDLLGGSIWAESQKDQGSAFYFTLPYIVTTSVTEEAVKRGRHIPVSAKPMVLLAEDDLSNTHYMSVVVKKSGCEFLHAANGEDAVKLCREHPDIAMVLMDIKMPVMNGLDATRLIREFRPDLPVVALTAYAQTGDEQRIMAAGCDEYIAKPVEPDLLIKMIKKYTVQ